jgi:LacI family transcriptional regulator
MKKRRRQRLSGGGVTIREVAARAGVSSMTVSRVINNEQKVSRSTREKVNAVIRELNYAPNRAAQGLAAARGLKVALLYDNPSAGFMSEFLLGALNESSRNGSQLLVLKHEPDEDTTSLVDSVVASGADGVVLPPPLSDSSETAEQLAYAGIAVVGVAPGRPSARHSTVRIDNERAARDIADHLIGLGHRSFGFIAGHPNQSVSEQRRWGFVDQLGKAGIPPSQIIHEQGYFTYKSGLEAAEKLLRRSVRPSALFVANDDMAAATLAVAHRLGLEIPRDLSIVGFDDTALAAVISPSLTTVRQPVAEMARTALALLTGELKSRRTSRVEHAQVLSKHALIVRESTGRALPPKRRK